MPLLYLVRHAKPAAGWGQDLDPGLDPLGVTQAQNTANELAASLPSLPIYSSPLRRCRETALPLERAWDRSAEIFHAVAEIPAPSLALAARHEWLVKAMQGTWQQLQESAPPGATDYLQWRRALLAALASLPGNCIIFSHYIAINVAVAAARKLENVVCFRPDHASVTIIESQDGAFEIVRLGREAETSVLTRG